VKILKYIFTTSALRRAYFLALFAYAAIMIVTYIIASSFFKYSEERVINEANETYVKVYHDYLNYLSATKSYIISNDTVINEDEFIIFMEEIDFNELPYDALLIAPSGVVESVYPLSEKQKYDGVDIIASYQNTEVEKFFLNMEEGIPISIYDDQGEGATFLLPIFIDDSFYGFTVIIINSSDISEIFDLYNHDKYDIGIVFNKEILVYGPEAKTAIMTNTEIKEIGNTNYHIYTVKTDDENRNEILFMVLFILAISGFFTFAMYLYIREYKNKEDLIEKLNYQNDYDMTTQILNHRKLFSDLDELIIENKEFYLAFGVFNNVKFIYNKFGKQIGEGIMIKSTSRITQILPKKNRFYRYGGDEYVIIFTNTNKGEVINTLRKITNLFETDIAIERARANVSMSFGIVSYPMNGRSSEELINNAHITLSQSKGFMRNNYEFFKLEHVSTQMHNQDFDDYISKLPIESFDVYLMPVVETETNKIVGFECLSRVKDEFGNNIPIQNVISSFERNGRIVELDEYVFKKITNIKELLNSKYDRDIFLSANCSALSLNDEYVDNIIKLYEDANLEYGTIVLELTESYKVDDHDYLVKLFKRLNDAGILIAIDDFGTGYSSLNYISKFPLHAIKIDKQYVRDYKDNEFNRTLMFTLLSIANVLDCLLVAEGVDEYETLEFLKNNKCHLYQGFLFSKGVSLSEALSLLDNEK